MSTLTDPIRKLHTACQEQDHRALVVIHGDRQATREQATRVLEALLPTGEEALLIAPDPLPGSPTRRVDSQDYASLLGTTYPHLIYEAHEGLDPNVLGASTGAVDGGGLYLLLIPALDQWPDEQDAFDEHLATEPYTVDDVTGRFERHLVRTLRHHEAILLHDADTGTQDKQATLPSPPATTPASWRPQAPRFPESAYAACRTPDQAHALHALETLTEPRAAVLLESDRGRGKSSALGLAAASLALDGRDVLVTAPRRENTGPLFKRVREHLTDTEQEPPPETPLSTDAGATITYRPPAEAAKALQEDQPNALLVDEAASLPVHLLTRLLQDPTPTAFATTVHGYEGAGRGFTLRFKDHLSHHDGPTREVTLTQPIRYAPDDPLERWSFHALLLDATPPPDAAVQDASPETTSFQPLDPETLLDDEALLREAFGLLVHAHYQTTPRDLARLLDAPNLHAAALLHEGHVASIALLAEEGSLPQERCEAIHEGAQIQGHLIPDVLMTQLRDKHAGEPAGLRVVRIATHPAIQRRGLGSHLLKAIHDAYEPDWFGTAFGATPDLIRFWDDNGYGTIHIGTSRNPASGEHSILMLRPQTTRGDSLVQTNTDWFIKRISSVLTDSLRDLDPDIVRKALSATRGRLPIRLTAREEDHLNACADGIGVFDTNPGPLRKLSVSYILQNGGTLDPHLERLIVRKFLQAHSWESLVRDSQAVSSRMAKRMLADAVEHLLNRQGTKPNRQDDS